MFKLNLIGFLGSAALSLLMFSSATHAQYFHEDEALLSLETKDRIPSELIAPGITRGGFLLFPKLEISETYSSNVYASPDNEKNDFITKITPSLLIRKEYDGHEFNLGARAQYDYYLSEQDENALEYGAFLNGTLKANSRWEFPFLLQYGTTARDRSSPLTQERANERLDIEKFISYAGVRRNFNRLSLTLLGKYTDIKNEDGMAFDNNTQVVFSDDDRSRKEIILRAEYDFPRDSEGIVPEHKIFAEIHHADVNYKNLQFQSGSFSGPQANFKEQGILGGFRTSYKGIVFANLGAGMKSQKFEDSSLKDNNILNLKADLAYNFLPKLTLNFATSRDVTQDTGIAQGILASNYLLGLDYELRHDWYIGGNVQYKTYDFETGDRKDEDRISKIYLKHYNSRNLETALEFNNQNRSSNSANNEFDRYEIMLRLTGKL
jgi:hypothetical protein